MSTEDRCTLCRVTTAEAFKDSKSGKLTAIRLPCDYHTLCLLCAKRFIISGEWTSTSFKCPSPYGCKFGNEYWFMSSSGRKDPKQEVVDIINNTTIINYKQLPSFTAPKFIFQGLAVQINENEFILAQQTPTDYKMYRDNITFIGIWSYNIYDKEWKILSPYPMYQQVLYHTINYSHARKSIIIHSATGHIIIYDIKNNKFHIKTAKQNLKEFITDDNWLRTDRSSTDKINHKLAHLTLLIEGKLNVFYKGMHFLWNGKKRSFQKKMDIVDINIKLDPEDDEEDLMKYGPPRFQAAVYIKSKNEILIFGGDHMDSDDYMYNIWKLDMNKGNGSAIWELLDNRLPDCCCDFGYVLSADERYIIMGSIDDGQLIAIIWDLEKMAFHQIVIESDIDGVCDTTDFDGECQMVLMPNVYKDEYEEMDG